MKNPVKKILCTVMVLLVVGTSGVVFTGCGSDNSKDSSSSTTSEVTTVPVDSNGKEYQKVTWATSGIGSELPVPDLTYGKVKLEKDTRYYVTMAGASLDDFEQYVNDCKSKGFTENYSKRDDFYKAEDKDGHGLTVKYHSDDNTLEIRVQKSFNMSLSE